MKTPVESCFHLDIKQLKGDLRLAREHKTDLKGFITISFENRKYLANYNIEYGPDHNYLVIRYGGGEQLIKLAESELHFGSRSWLICECDRRLGKLYLPPHSKEFKCRHCHHLYYRSTRVNRSNKYGLFLYKADQVRKIVELRANMTTTIYRSQYTKRFMRFLKLCEGVGLFEKIREAENALEAINSLS